MSGRVGSKVRVSLLNVGSTFIQQADVGLSSIIRKLTRSMLGVERNESAISADKFKIALDVVAAYIIFV